MNVAPMILRFCSGSVTPAKPIEEQIGRIDEIERQLQLVAKPLLDLVGFVVTQQSVVDEDARQPIANRAMNEHRRDRGVHAARRARTPPCPAPTCCRMRSVASSMNEAIVQSPVQPHTPIGEVPQDLDAVVRVHDFRVEQQRIQLRARVLPSRRSAPSCSSRPRKPRRHGRHIVAVARPDPEFVGHAR